MNVHCLFRVEPLLKFHFYIGISSLFLISIGLSYQHPGPSITTPDSVGFDATIIVDEPFLPRRGLVQDRNNNCVSARAISVGDFEDLDVYISGGNQLGCLNEYGL
jgi:hypothetical protein